MLLFDLFNKYLLFDYGFYQFYKFAINKTVQKCLIFKNPQQPYFVTNSNAVPATPSISNVLEKTNKSLVIILLLFDHTRRKFLDMTFF